MLVTRTSTKAIAVLVIALACVFGAPAVAKAGFVPPPLQNQATAKPERDAERHRPRAAAAKSTDAVSDRVEVRRRKRRDDVLRHPRHGRGPHGLAAVWRSAAPIRRSARSRRTAASSGQSVTSGPHLAARDGRQLAPELRSVSPAPKAPGIAIVDSGIDTSRDRTSAAASAASVDFTGAQRRRPAATTTATARWSPASRPALAALPRRVADVEPLLAEGRSPRRHRVRRRRDRGRRLDLQERVQQQHPRRELLAAQRVPELRRLRPARRRRPPPLADRHGRRRVRRQQRPRPHAVRAGERPVRDHRRRLRHRGHRDAAATTRTLRGRRTATRRRASRSRSSPRRAAG